MTPLPRTVRLSQRCKTEFDAISSILPYHKAGKAGTVDAACEGGFGAWPADSRQIRPVVLVPFGTTAPTRSPKGPLLPKSDVNHSSESCFRLETSIAKRFKAVAWRRPEGCLCQFSRRFVLPVRSILA